MSDCVLAQTLAVQLQSLRQAHSVKRIFVALSGGADSTALLHGVCGLSLNIPIIALHVHHGLSANADDWALHVENFCQGLNVPCIVERVVVENQGSGIEQAARLARYQVFAQHMQKGDVLLMGHHQDDQIETFMMRLMRGSGLTGLTVMQALRPMYGGFLLRPMLDISRDTIEAYVTKHKLINIEDESNTDTQFDRNWWRQDMLPKLQQRYPQSAQSIVKTISILQDEHQLLNDLIEPIYRKVMDGQGCLDSNKLLRESWSIQCQLIRRWLEEHERFPLLADRQIAILLNDVLKAKPDAEPLYQWQDNEVRRHNGRLYCMAKLPSLADFTVQQYGNHQHLVLVKGSLTQQTSAGIGLKPGQYEVVLYDGSLKAKAINRPSKVLKQWFQEFSIPPWQRPYWPIFLYKGEVAAVPGLFVCQGYGAQQGWQLDFDFDGV